MGARAIPRQCGEWGSAIWAAFLFVVWAGACGKTSQSARKLSDGSSGGVGGSETETGTGSGGATGTGGVKGDAGLGIACSDDGGVGFAAVARQCTQDSECTILTAATCCGPDGARGIATGQASAYAACFALPPGGCGELGCPKYVGYLTDTGNTTPFEGTATQLIDLVSVQCVAHLCTTDVVPPADAGQDVTPTGDAAPDVGSDALPISIDDAGITQKQALLERMCWGDGLATVQTLADPSTFAACVDDTLQPCQFPISLAVGGGRNCTVGLGGGTYCIADFVYVPPFQEGGAPSCLQCGAASVEGTALLFVVRIPPTSAFSPLACPPHPPSSEARFLVWSLDVMALYRIGGTDQMATIVGVEEVDRNLYDQWTSSQ